MDDIRDAMRRIRSTSMPSTIAFLAIVQTVFKQLAVMSYGKNQSREDFGKQMQEIGHEAWDNVDKVVRKAGLNVNSKGGSA